MAADKFVKSFLVLFFLGCAVRNGFCAPYEDGVRLSNGTVLKMVIGNVVEAPPPRYDNALDANRKDENDLPIVIHEAQPAPPPRVMSKRDVEDDNDGDVGDDDNMETESKVLPTTLIKNVEEPLKTSTPSVAGVAQTTTVLGVQVLISNNSEKSVTKFTESSESEIRGNAAGQPADDADDDADEAEDGKGQGSTIQTALPPSPINKNDGSEVIGSKDGRGAQGDTKKDANMGENTTDRNGVDDQSNKNDVEPSEKNNDNKPNGKSIDSKPPGEEDDEENFDDATNDENNDEPVNNEDNKIVKEGGDEGYGDDEDDDDSNNRNAEEDSTREEDKEEVGDDDGQPSALDRSSFVKKNNVSESPSSGHFMSYFLIAVVFVACFYLVFHNRQKIKAYVLEGRNGRGRKRKAGDSEYRQLSTAEEVLPSADKGIESKATYTY